MMVSHELTDEDPPTLCTTTKPTTHLIINTEQQHHLGVGDELTINNSGAENFPSKKNNNHSVTAAVNNSSSSSHHQPYNNVERLKNNDSSNNNNSVTGTSSPLQRTKPFVGSPAGSTPSNHTSSSSSLIGKSPLSALTPGGSKTTTEDIMMGIDSVAEEVIVDDEDDDDDDLELVIKTRPPPINNNSIEEDIMDEGDDEMEDDDTTMQNNTEDSVSLSTSHSSSICSTSSHTNKFPMLDLSALNGNKKAKLTSVMQHSFMITPKRIGSNLVNSYEMHHNQHHPKTATNQQVVDQLDLPTSSINTMSQSNDDEDDLNLGTLNLSKTKTATHQVYLHRRGISFSKEVDTQVNSDDEDNLKCVTSDLHDELPPIKTKPHHEKRTSVVTQFNDDDLGLSIYTKKPSDAMMVDDDDLSVKTFTKDKQPSYQKLMISTKQLAVNQRAMTDDNSDSPVGKLNITSSQQQKNTKRGDDSNKSSNNQFLAVANNSTAPTYSPRSPNNTKSVSFMMPSTMKSGANPYHYNKITPSKPPVYNLERHVLSSEDEFSNSQLADPEYVRQHLELLFTNTSSHQCQKLEKEFEELEEIDMNTWLHKRLYFRTGLKFMDMNRYSNVLPNEDTRFKLYKGIGPVMHMNFSSQQIVSNFALLANPLTINTESTPTQSKSSSISITSSNAINSSASNSGQTNSTNNNQNANNNRVLSPNAELLSSWEEDYINANLIKTRKEFLFNWDEFSINTSPLSITGSNESVPTNYNNTRKEREELAEKVNMVDYICTQGPLPYSASHFWRMIYQSNSHIILMIGREQEETGVKCAIYYPTPSTTSNSLTLSSTLTTSSSLDGVSPRNMLTIPGMKNGATDSIIIDVAPPKTIPTTQKWKLEITIPKREHGDDEEAVKWIVPKELIQRALIMKLKRTKLNSDEEEVLDVRKVHLVQYVGWIDQSVPSHISFFQKVIDHVNELIEKRKNDLLSLSPLLPSNTVLPSHMGKSVLDSVGPIVVHCSAGIGRTGTFCAVDCALKQFKAHIFKHVHSLKNQNSVSPPTSSRMTNIPAFPFNIFNVVKKLKEHRTGMVQTEHQYEFVYKAVIRCYSDILKKFNINMLERKK